MQDRGQTIIYHAIKAAVLLQTSRRTFGNNKQQLYSLILKCNREEKL